MSDIVLSTLNAKYIHASFGLRYLMANMGGLKSRTLQEMLDRRPEEVIRIAVRGMLPKNRLARKQMVRLKIYVGDKHPHSAVNPPKATIRTP